MIHPETLAKKFSARLRKVLTPAQVSEAFSRNATETNPGVCHSHDFCDANEVMAQAVLDCGMDYDFLEQHPQVVDAAWKIAKESGFLCEAE
jgi:hypothetical protein